MPGYKAHIVGGVATFAVLAFLVKGNGTVAPSVAFQWLGAAVLGSLFPDVDIKSKGQGIFYKGVLLCLCILLWKKYVYPFIVLSFLALLPVLVRHRGLFHQAWFVIVAPLMVAYAVGYSFPIYQSSLLQMACFFSAGAVSHLVLDRIF